MTAAAPVLHTARLTLTRHAPDDLDDLAAIWADPRVYGHIGGQPRSREEVWIQLLRHIGQWAVFGRGMWVLRETATGRLIGEAGLMDARRDIRPPMPDIPEAGWILAGDGHGRGFAREAMDAVLAWTGQQGMTRTACIIDPGNAASIRLADRLGYRLLDGTRYRAGKPILGFVRG